MLPTTLTKEIEMPNTRRLLIYGGSGALGSHCARYFRARGWWIFNVDLAASEIAHTNCIIKLSESLPAQEEVVGSFLKDTIGVGALDGILCVAGGWTGGNLVSKEFILNPELIWYHSVQSSLVAASLAPTFLKEGGLLLLTGAESAQTHSTKMIVAKAAVHQLTRCFSSARKLRAVGILPVPPVLDTPNNRKWMPNADFETWTSLDEISRILEGWLEDKESSPKSGSFVHLVTKDGKTELFIH